MRRRSLFCVEAQVSNGVGWYYVAWEYIHAKDIPDAEGQARQRFALRGLTVNEVRSIVVGRFVPDEEKTPG